MQQLKGGIKPEKGVHKETRSGSEPFSWLAWLVNAYEAINKREFVEKVNYLPKYLKLLFLTRSS